MGSDWYELKETSKDEEIDEFDEGETPLSDSYVHFASDLIGNAFVLSIPYIPNNEPKNKSVNKYLTAIEVFPSLCYTIRVLKSKKW